MTERIMAMSLYHGFIVSSFRAQVEDCFFGLFSDSFSVVARCTLPAKSATRKTLEMPRGEAEFHRMSGI